MGTGGGYKAHMGNPSLAHNMGARDNNCAGLKMKNYDRILGMKWLVKYMDGAIQGERP